MDWRTHFLLIVSILGAVSLSCHGPETGTFAPQIAAQVPESNHDRESRIDKMRYDKELIMLVGLIDSLL